MRTFYIDVFFLVNATVDILSLYFSAIFSKVPSTSKRIIISGLLGAFISVFVALFSENTLLKIIFSIVGLLLTCFFATKTVSFKRKIKFIFSFLVFESLFGGLISFVWGIFDTYLYKIFRSVGTSAVNRKMLYFSIIIFFAIGVFKMLISFFSNIESEGAVELEILFLNKKANVEAFIDSGNLAIDPMDMRPVLFLKRKVAEKLFPESILDLRDPDSVDRETRKRIRLIPVSRGGSTHVLVGVRVDSVNIVKNNKREEIYVTVAIDKEGGSFGGYDALMPAAVFDNGKN